MLDIVEVESYGSLSYACIEYEYERKASKFRIGYAFFLLTELLNCVGMLK